jgi:hypothetical protein
MKKLFCVLLVMAVLCGFCAVAGSAETQGGYTYQLENGGAVITAYTGSATDLKIPGTLGGSPVLEIGSNAFYENKSINKATIPSSVTVIGASAFEGCSSLRSISFGNSLVTIGDSAFEGCGSLASVTLPETLTTIGASAFSGCVTLINAIIPKSVTSIGENAFEDCRIVIIFSSADAYAKTYADANGIPFVQKSHAWWLGVPVFFQSITRIFFFGWLWMPLL